jgi:hypothetical protein
MLQIWTPLPIGTRCIIASIQYIGAAQVYPVLILQQISWTLYGDNNSPRFAYLSGHYLQYWFCLIGSETEKHKIKDDCKIKREKNIDRRGQRHILNVWHLSEPPFFSLPTTFKRFQNSCSAMHMVLVQRLQYSIEAPFLRSIVRISRIYHTRSRSAISSELETCKMFFLLLCL